MMQQVSSRVPQTDCIRLLRGTAVMPQDCGRTRASVPFVTRRREIEGHDPDRRAVH